MQYASSKRSEHPVDGLGCAARRVQAARGGCAELAHQQPLPGSSCFSTVIDVKFLFIPMSKDPVQQANNRNGLKAETGEQILIPRAREGKEI